MFDTEKLEEMLSGVNAQASPVLLMNYNHPAEQIQELAVIEVYPAPQGAQADLNRKLTEGFQIAQLMVLRKDCINYGASGASAVEHTVVAVLVKL